MEIKDRLRLARIVNGISQEYVANCLNVSQSTYSRYKSGVIKISVEKLFEILEILEVDLINLLQLDEKKIFLSNYDFYFPANKLTVN
jgi:transcriptional regulator with XRE-family HTH domain